MYRTKYSVIVTLYCNSGYIKVSNRQCKSSALGCCSFVAALLYAVNDCLEHNRQDQTENMHRHKHKLNVEHGTQNGQATKETY